MNPAEATREILWNAPWTGLMYVLLVPTVAIAAWGLWRRVRLWRRGRPEPRFDRPAERLALLLRHAVLQGRTLRERHAGVLHLLLFTGLLVLTAATTVVLLDHDFGTRIMRGGFYLVFQSLVVDLFGALVLVGVGLAALRRFVTKPRQLVFTGEAGWILLVIFVLAATGFLLEGWRIAVTDDPWGAWSPVGWLVARGSEAVMSDGAMTAAHAATWWFHLAVTFAFLAWAPYTKMVHVVTGPLNIFFANLDGPAGALRPIDFDDEGDEPFGVNDLGQLSWKALLDLDACTECGRCNAACPAHGVGKSLSPRDIVLDLRGLAHANAATLRAGGSVPIPRDGTALAPESLWQCTTCAACMEACPVYIEQVPRIVDARRYLVMEEAEMPDTMAEALASLEKRGHPYPGTRLSRVDWAEGLEVPVLSELDDPSEVDVVLWVGCANALVERNHGIVRALAQLLHKAGVRFAVLGREERCTGDPARRMGNEFLFETAARKTIGTLERYGVKKGVKKIVTSCPHCFNTFKNDYPALGGELDVEHHTSFLDRLVAEGRLVPDAARSVTFHDPCYLGRYNGEFEAPRRLLDDRAVEMGRTRERSLCCGGGGGMSFTDEPPGQRVNRRRAREAVDTGAEVVATACPFCVTMLEDGVKSCGGERPPEVKDVAELLWGMNRD